MFVSIENTHHYSKTYLKSKIKRTAKHAILLTSFGASEVALNEYMLKKYNKTLKVICIDLVLRSEISADPDDNFILRFKTKADDTLAALITYGNGKLQGSKILRHALTQKY